MNFLQSLAQQFASKPIDWDELEEALIRADLGVPMTMRIIKTLQEREAWALLGIGDVMNGLVKSVLFGIVIGLSSCQFGLGVTGGAPGVGRGVNATVVASAAGIFIVDYLVSFLLG